MPELCLIENGNIYCPDNIIEKGSLLIEDGKIARISDTPIAGLPAGARVINAAGKIVAPGFIDLHCNGGGGAIAVEGTTEAVETIIRAHARFGTTGMLLTTITVGVDLLLRSLGAIADVAARYTLAQGSKILGVHFESLFLSEGKRGAHLIQYLKKPDVALFDRCRAASRDMIRLISMAPELEGAEALIADAQNRGIVVSFAHSEGGYELAKHWMDQGVRLCTHLFNAMTPFLHRSPGAPGAFLTSDGACVMIIPDGVHVAPAALELTYRAKKPSEIILVTDCIAPAGTDLKEIEFLGRKLEIIGDACYLAGGLLAGNALTMNRAIKLFQEYTSASLLETINMASLNPARILGLDKTKGSLEVGKDADVVILDQEMNVEMTMIEGEMVYSKENK